MKRLYMYLLLVCLLVFFVVGCFRQPTPTQPTNPDKPLFTDADIDAARVQPTTTEQALTPQDLGETSTATELDPLQSKETKSDFETTAVLPGVEGFVYYFEYNPSLTNPSRVLRFDQATNTNTLIYSGNRRIQAVGGSSDGTILLLSMRQTIDVASDFEIFRFQVTPIQVQQLTDNAVDDTNVSLSASGLVAAWQSPNASGVSTIYIHNYPDVTSSTGTLITLSNTRPQVHPSISGNGNFLVFIRELAEGKDRVIRYNVGANTYLTIVTTAVSLEHPSVSDDGEKVLWLQHNTNGDAARLKNLTASTIQTVVNNANGVRHPFLTGDGFYITFGLVRSSVWQVMTQNLASGNRVQGSFGTVDAKGMVWQLPDLSSPEYPEGDYPLAQITLLPDGTDEPSDGVTYTVEIIDGEYVLEGDMILGSVSTGLITQGSVIRGPLTRWEGGILPYEIEPGFTSSQIEKIESAIEIVDSMTNATLKPRTNEVYWVRFKLDTIGIGEEPVCSAKTGRLPPESQPQYILLHSGCSTYTIVHEILHTLGLYHEQSREDRNTYVTYLGDNVISEKKKSQFEQKGGEDIGAYDFDSVMHYSPSAFAKNPNACKKDTPEFCTIIPKDINNFDRLGQRKQLSPGDIATVNDLYPLPRPSISVSGQNFRVNGSSGNASSFSPTSQSYTVSNTGTVPATVEVFESVSWLDEGFSGRTFMIPVGSSEVFSFDLDTDRAATYDVGTYSDDDIVFRLIDDDDSNDASTETRFDAILEVASSSSPGSLQITGSDYIASGVSGNPSSFSPTTQTYTAKNVGGLPITIDVYENVSWLDEGFSDRTFTLVPSQSLTFDMVLDTTYAAGRSPGQYTDTDIHFVNTTNGLGTIVFNAVLNVSSSSSSVELLQNGSFSSGQSNWTVSGNAYMGTTLSNSRTAPGYAALGVTSSGSAINNADGGFAQAISIPPGKSTATFKFYKNITTAETDSTVKDFVLCQVKSGTIVLSEVLLTNLHAVATAGVYSLESRTFSISSYSSVSVFCAGVTDGSNKTVFRLDDFSLVVQ